MQFIDIFKQDDDTSRCQFLLQNLRFLILTKWNQRSTMLSSFFHKILKFFWTRNFWNTTFGMTAILGNGKKPHAWTWIWVDYQTSPIWNAVHVILWSCFLFLSKLVFEAVPQISFWKKKELNERLPEAFAANLILPGYNIITPVLTTILKNHKNLDYHPLQTPNQNKRLRLLLHQNSCNWYIEYPWVSNELSHE